MDDFLSFSFRINGLPVTASFSEKNIEEIFVPLLFYLSELQQKKDGRLIVFLSAPPASGKSTLASFLQYLSETRSTLTPIISIGMDGFHLPQAHLMNNGLTIDGKIVPLAKIKGAPPTFDLAAIHSKIAEIASGSVCKWPFYDRVLHNPVQDASTVDRDIVLIEGNYLLLDKDGWKDLKQYADYTIRIIADPDMLRSRLIERKLESSRKPLSYVEKFVDFSDMRNVDLCLNNSFKSDLTLRLEQDNSFSPL